MKIKKKLLKLLPPGKYCITNKGKYFVVTKGRYKGMKIKINFIFV